MGRQTPTRTLGVRYPVILGTGGNDGRLDFTNNFMARLVHLFDMQQNPMAPNPWAAAHLSSALFGAPTPQLLGSSVGQFLPGNAGGANASSSGFDGPSQINPWDFVLMLEGTLSLRSSVVRRSSVREAPQAAAPFAVRSESSGLPVRLKATKPVANSGFLCGKILVRSTKSIICLPRAAASRAAVLPANPSSLRVRSLASTSVEVSRRLSATGTHTPFRHQPSRGATTAV